MTKEELIEKVNENIEMLTEKLENPPADYLYYANFVHSYNLKSLAGLVEIPPLDFATVMLFPGVIEEMDFNDFLEDILSFRKVFEELDPDDMGDISEAFSAFVHAGQYELLANIFNDVNKLRATKNIRKHLLNKKSSAVDRKRIEQGILAVEKIILKNGEPGWDVSKLIEYCEDHPNAVSNTIAMIKLLREFGAIKNDVDLNSEEYMSNKGVCTILRYGGKIIECKKYLCDEQKKYEDKLRSERGIYKKFLKDIESAFEKEEITNYTNIIHDIDDEELIMEFLKLVYQHNKPVYDRIDALNDQLKRDSLVNYLNVLKNYGIKKEEVDLNKVIHNSCEDLDKMLKILNAIVPEKDKIIEIIEISDLANVSYFKELKTNGVLSTGAFLRYPEIFGIDSELRKKLDNNIKIINDFNIDGTLFCKQADILIENDNLLDSLDTLRYYNLLDNLKTSRKHSFLKKNGLCEVIDKIIELGYEDLLLEDISLLNENNWDRIYVLKSMGVQPESKEELIKYLRDDKFFVPDDKLKLYIEDASKYYNSLGIDYNTDMLKIVKDNANTERSLSFDGVIISKNRVVRNLTKEDFDINDLADAIIKNCILSMDEVETIKSCLKNKIYKLD